MVLLDAALHLVYVPPYRCRYAHRRLARLGSPIHGSPRGADRATLSSAQGGLEPHRRPRAVDSASSRDGKHRGRRLADVASSSSSQLVLLARRKASLW